MLWEEGTQMTDETENSQPQEAVPTNFRRHIWLLITILAIVVLAAVISRVHPDDDAPEPATEDGPGPVQENR